MRRWETITSDIALTNRWLTLRRDTCRLPDGSVIDDYYVLHENDIGCVFALTPAHEVVLVEQYKHGVGAVLLELPAGYFETGAADAAAEARRELVEETGFDVERLYPVGVLPISPSRTTIQMHLYAGVGAHPVGGQHLDATETIDVRLLALDEVFAAMRDGRITATTTIAGVFMAWDFLRRQGIV